MNEKLQELLEMTREAAIYAGNVAGKGFDAVANKTGELAELAKLNKQVFEKGTTISALLMDAGEIVYATHCGEETDPDQLQQILEQIDGEKAELEAIKDRISELKNERFCPTCHERVESADRFCKYCGQELEV